MAKRDQNRNDKRDSRNQRDSRERRKSNSSRSKSGSSKKKTTSNKKRKKKSKKLNKNWKSLNKTHEKIIRELARQEMDKDGKEVRLRPEKEIHRDKAHREFKESRSSLVSGEDDTLERLEEETEHLRQLRNRLKQLQEEQQGRERSVPQRRPEQMERPEYRGPATTREKQEIDYRKEEVTEEQPQEPIYKSDKRGLSGFISKRSKIEVFLLGVLTGMAIIFLINIIMVPPIAA